MVQTQFPDSTQIDDVISLDLADKMGKWVGDCGSEKCKAIFQIRKDFSFNQIGDHNLKFQQHSRTDSLLDIHSLGLRLVSNSEK